MALGDIGEIWAEIDPVSGDRMALVAARLHEGLHASHDGFLVVLERGPSEVLHLPFFDLRRLAGSEHRRHIGEVARYDHDAVHDHPVSREGADVGVDTRLGWRLEAQHMNEAVTGGADHGSAFDDEGLLRFGDEVGVGIFRVPGHLIRRHPDLAQGARLNDDQVVVGGVRVGEHQLDRLAGLDSELLQGEFHHLRFAGDLDQLEVPLGIELGLPGVDLGLPEAAHVSGLLDEAGDVVVLVAGGVPGQGAGAQGAARGIGEVSADGVLEDVHDGFKRFLAAEIAGRDHGLHAYDAVVIVGGIVEEFQRVGELLMPVAKLVNRRGSRPVVAAPQEFA